MVDLGASVTETHLQWLRQDLASTSRPSIVFSHFSPADQDLADSFWFHDAPKSALLRNRRQLREILEDHHVPLFVNGHLHWNNRTNHKGIDYITIQSELSSGRFSLRSIIFLVFSTHHRTTG
jgi:hypothetical protein